MVVLTSQVTEKRFKISECQDIYLPMKKARENRKKTIFYDFQSTVSPTILINPIHVIHQKVKISVLQSIQ